VFACLHCLAAAPAAEVLCDGRSPREQTYFAIVSGHDSERDPSLGARVTALAIRNGLQEFLAGNSEGAPLKKFLAEKIDLGRREGSLLTG